jgi:hypothetical protein
MTEGGRGEDKGRWKGETSEDGEGDVKRRRGQEEKVGVGERK